MRGLFMTAAGNSGNAASRVETFIQSRGAYAYGGYPDIDDLFQQQASERDVERREALLANYPRDGSFWSIARAEIAAGRAGNRTLRPGAAASARTMRCVA